MASERVIFEVKIVQVHGSGEHEIQHHFSVEPETREDKQAAMEMLRQLADELQGELKIRRIEP
jgi:plasmid stability protein